MTTQLLYTLYRMCEFWYGRIASRCFGVLRKLDSQALTQHQMAKQSIFFRYLKIKSYVQQFFKVH